MDIAKLLQGRAVTIHSCTADTQVTEASRLLAERRIGALPVLDGDRVTGMFSERDVLYAIAREGATALDRKVGEVMTSPAITIGLNTGIMEALGLMTLRRIRHLPVMDGDVMVGLVSIGDLVKLRVEAAEAEAEAMRVYIQSA